MRMISFAALMVLAGANASANDFIDTARVISSTPIVETINEPRQECSPAPAQGAQAPAQQCRTVQVSREIIKGYTVVYHYSGRDVTVKLPYDPGPTVRVGIGVIDNAPAPRGSPAHMMGSNVRDVTPVPTPPVPVYDAAPKPVGNTGGYQYRY